MIPTYYIEVRQRRSCVGGALDSMDETCIRLSFWLLRSSHWGNAS